MRLVIVGGSGQLGLATAECVAGMDIETYILSRRAPVLESENVKWVGVDVGDREALLACFQKIRPNSVLNLAALLQFACSERPRSAIDVNVHGAINVLDACCLLDVERVIFGSSIAVYGERTSEMFEDDPIPADANLYALTKLLGERLGEQYHRLYGLKVLALRYSGIFGGREAATSGMSQVRSKILLTASGQDVVIDEASGDELIHLTDVSDAAEATCRALFEPAPHYSIYNVAGPKENYISLRDLHSAVRAHRPGCGSIKWMGKAKSAGLVNTDRLANDLKFIPRRKFSEQIARLIPAGAMSLLH